MFSLMPFLSCLIKEDEKLFLIFLRYSVFCIFYCVPTYSSSFQGKPSQFSFMRGVPDSLSLLLSFSESPYRWLISLRDVVESPAHSAIKELQLGTHKSIIIISYYSSPYFMCVTKLF